MVLILLLILVAKGYTVVRYNLTRSAILKISVFMILYIAAIVVMFVWENILFDPGLVLYHYESPPGYGMLTVILIGWLWFTMSAVCTLKHNSSKTKFYVLFYTIYTIWFWAGPVVVLIAMFVMAKWTREKTVNGVQQSIEFMGHLFFLMLTLPHRVNHNFPYHIRTTKEKPVSDQHKQHSSEDSSDIINKRAPFPSKGSDLVIITKSKSLQVDEDNLDLMLSTAADFDCHSDGKISLNVSQNIYSYRLFLPFDNDSSDTDSTSVGDNRPLHGDTPLQLGSISLNTIDESSSHL
ncbi:unnamed protein product [Candidula unifasciata]|uniref:GPR180/TMEM145 transmembrane domain-containing protein n=1 Tax=Candidula unifasciata TaxID=100452 RepID=A0A8S3ZF82_9EUPU|nr:unnamed protein product [Candidula unifasciata]